MGIAEPMRNNPSDRKVGVNLGSNPVYLHCLNALRFVTFVYRYFRVLYVIASVPGYIPSLARKSCGNRYISFH